MQSNLEHAKLTDQNRDSQLGSVNTSATCNIATIDSDFAPARRFRAGDRMRALVVDDDVTTRRVHSRLLSIFKIHNSTAGDGLEAVAMAMAAADAGDPFDLILMDLEMPVVDGWGAALTLRANGFTGGIIAISGCVGAEVEQRCVMCGFDLYLPKPIDAQLLIAAVGRFTRFNNTCSNNQSAQLPIRRNIKVVV